MDQFDEFEVDMDEYVDDAAFAYKKFCFIRMTLRKDFFDIADWMKDDSVKNQLVYLSKKSKMTRHKKKKWDLDRF